MALTMNGLLKGWHFRRRNYFINVSEATRKFLSGNQIFQGRKKFPFQKKGLFSLRKASTPNKWVEGRGLEPLPDYIFWPAENRYGKVLWWGYGSIGLFFIEKGKGYVYAGTKEVFYPATEPDYLDYLKKNSE